MNKNQIIRIRINDTEKSIWKSQAQALGMSLSAFIRECVFWAIQEKITIEKEMEILA